MPTDYKPKPFKEHPANIAVLWAVHRAKTMGIMKCILQVTVEEMNGGLFKSRRGCVAGSMGLQFLQNTESGLWEWLVAMRNVFVKMHPQLCGGIIQVSDAAFRSDLESWSPSTFVLDSLLSLKMLLGWRMSLCSFHCRLSHCICFGTDLKFCLTSWLL